MESKIEGVAGGQELVEVQTAEEFKHLLGQRIGIKNPNPKEHVLYQDAATKHV